MGVIDNDNNNTKNNNETTKVRKSVEITAKVLLKFYIAYKGTKKICTKTKNVSRNKLRLVSASLSSKKVILQKNLVEKKIVVDEELNAYKLKKRRQDIIKNTLKQENDKQKEEQREQQLIKQEELKKRKEIKLAKKREEKEKLEELKLIRQEELKKQKEIKLAKKREEKEKLEELKLIKQEELKKQKEIRLAKRQEEREKLEELKLIRQEELKKQKEIKLAKKREEKEKLEEQQLIKQEELKKQKEIRLAKKQEDRLKKQQLKASKLEQKEARKRENEQRKQEKLEIIKETKENKKIVDEGIYGKYELNHSINYMSKKDRKEPTVRILNDGACVIDDDLKWESVFDVAKEDFDTEKTIETLKDANKSYDMTALVKKVELGLLVAALTSTVVFVGYSASNIYSKYVFSQEKWHDYPDDRIKMIDDMQEKYVIKGMNKEKVVDLLGMADYKLTNKECEYLELRNYDYTVVEEYKLNEKSKNVTDIIPKNYAIAYNKDGVAVWTKVIIADSQD